MYFSEVIGLRCHDPHSQEPMGAPVMIARSVWVAVVVGLLRLLRLQVWGNEC